MPTDDADEAPMTTGDVARVFGVSAVTVGTWADQGLLPHFRTPGGRRRFRRVEVEAFLNKEGAA